jgi:hypothetical protein
MNCDRAPDKFWMVYGIGRGCPTKQHWSKADAEREAKRLARENPGSFFVVLEAVAAIAKREFDVITFRADDDGIPF